MIAASVNGVWGILRHQLCAGARDFFARQEYWHVLDVARGGDCPRFSEMDQPARHFFTADELRALFEGAGLMAVELGAARDCARGRCGCRGCATTRPPGPRCASWSA